VQEPPACKVRGQLSLRENWPEWVPANAMLVMAAGALEELVILTLCAALEVFAA
jgi:hypothetical protein